MAVNPDPRPGRWILPLVVLGMIAFTYFFVKQLPGAEADTRALGSTTTVTGVSTSTTTGTGETTSTTLSGEIPEDVRTYLTSLDTLAQQLTGFQTEMATVNSGFDQKSISFSQAASRLTALSTNVASWRDDVKQLTPPTGLEDDHQTVVAAAESAAKAAADAIAGLRSTDTGQKRRAAVAAFDTAVSDFNAAVAGAGETATGVPSTSSTTSTTGG